MKNKIDYIQQIKQSDIEKLKAAPVIRRPSKLRKLQVTLFCLILAWFIFSTEGMRWQQDKIADLSTEIESLKVRHDKPLALFHTDELCEDGLIMTWRSIPVCGYI